MLQRPPLTSYSPQSKNIMIGKIYEHYSGKHYRVLTLARHSETLEEVVVYEDLSDNNIWIRPLDMFLGQVIVEGRLRPRFKVVDLESEEQDLF